MLEKTEKYTSIDMGEDGQVSLRLTTTNNGQWCCYIKITP
jgi:hypothetical protein